MDKPQDMFDRDREWQALDDFVSTNRMGSTLALVYGRRRQGKTFLLESLTDVHGGLYVSALKQSAAQNLERLAEAYRTFTRSRARVHFASWEEAMEALLALGENATEPVVVVLDEFPYLLDGAPELPSVLQSLLRPKGPAAQHWKTRLILCGSALSTMRSLLTGTAPLRGRASLELLVHPFGYRDAASFWQVAHDPELAVRLHSMVGGTPGYRDMCANKSVKSASELDRWVVANLLNPASAMFREGNALLSEEDHVVDTAAYFAVLSAISQGRTRRGEIAAAIGKADGALAHPLTVLIQAGLVTALSDATRQKRTTYHVAEPALRLHQLVIAPNESRLTRHHSAQVWDEVADAVAARIYGPHFEDLARTWSAEHAALATLGGTASKVGATEVACPQHRCNHEIDVAVVEVLAQSTDRVTALGEAKWRTGAVGLDHLTRLEHLRDLMVLSPTAKLLLFSRAGFTDALNEAVARRPDVELVDLHRLYAGS
ncbi:MAG: AAA family ATPase [Dermatophilaceae bacterium]